MNREQAQRAIEERRLRRVALGMRDVAAMLVMDVWAHFSFDLPSDANCVSVYFDHAHDSFFVVFAHSSFQPLDPGVIIPYGGVGEVQMADRKTTEDLTRYFRERDAGNVRGPRA